MEMFNALNVAVDAITAGEIITSLGYWNYLIIAVLVALEGSATTLMAAALAGAGVLNPILVFFAAATGNFAADSGWYFLGYCGRFDTLKERIPFLKRFESHVDALSNTVHQHAVKFVVITKLTLGLATIPTLIAAGMARVSWLKLLPASIISEVIWTGALVMLGMYLGDYVSEINESMRLIALIGGVFMLLLGTMLWQQITKIVSRQTASQSVG